MQKWLNGAGQMRPAFAAAGASFAAPEQNQADLRMFAGASRGSSGSQGGSGHYQQQKPPKKGISRRAILSLVLLVLLPPVSIALMWYKNIFETRGRVLLTVIGTVIMGVMFSFMMPETAVLQAQPVAVKASLRSPLPTDAALNALSNMQELLAGVENQPIEDPAANDDTGEAAPTGTPEPTQPPEDPMQTVVYSVNTGAKYYHKSSECRGQVNRRALLVEQALAEGLKPCGRCDPVSP